LNPKTHDQIAHVNGTLQIFSQENEGKANNVEGAEEYSKKIEELTQQIDSHKAELADKQKLFEQASSWRRNIHHNDIQHNDTQHGGLNSDIRHYDSQHNFTQYRTLRYQFVIMLSVAFYVAMLSVI
jgi:seryl-tRNA synthetase